MTILTTKWDKFHGLLNNLMTLYELQPLFSIELDQEIDDEMEQKRNKAVVP
jgi:hypothetical protein